MKAEAEFYTRKNRPTPLSSACKACFKARLYTKRNADPDARRASARSYYRKNAGKVYARNCAWRKANWERMRPFYVAATKRRRAVDPEGINASIRAWKAAHREDVNARRRAYGVTERGRLASRVSTSLRRARKLAATVGPVDFKAIYARDGGRCWICWLSIPFSRVHFDHVEPLARGGEHSMGNIRTACQPCNERKSDAIPTPALIARIGEEVRRLAA
jgi:5-methylcytosine-specific restriction endonuclease McrA